MKSNSDKFSIDDVGIVSICESNKDGADKEKESDIASVVQSTSGDSGGIDANEADLPLVAEASLKIDELSNKTTADSSASSVSASKKNTKK